MRYILLLIIITLPSCALSENYSDYSNNKGNKLFEQGYFQDARNAYQDSQKAQPENYIAKNNESIIDYGYQDYEVSRKSLEAITKNKCNAVKKDFELLEDKEKKGLNTEYCDQVYYNLGNALYRQGEQLKNKKEEEEKNMSGKSNFSKVQQLWQNSIQAYSNSLVINPEDTETQENLEFVKKKLQESIQEEQKKQEQGDSEEKQEGENSEQSEGQEGQTPEGEEGKKEDFQNPNPSNQKPKDWKPNIQMTPQREKEAQDYKENLKEQEANLRKFFKPYQKEDNKNPQKQQDPFGIFNDPFFQKFFGVQENPFNQDAQNGVEKDW